MTRMKRLPVQYRPDALDDIDAIFLYILEASQSFQTAQQFTERLLARCDRIGNAPSGGAPRPDLGPDIRMVPFEHHAVILYREVEAAVDIVNVFYRGRDYRAIMTNKP
jgi:toxin ParE1/3/4